MVSISLLPPEYRQLSLLRRQKNIILLSGCIVILLLLLLGRFVSLNNEVGRNQLESMLAYQHSLENRLSSLAYYEEIYAQVLQMNQIIQKAAGNQIDWGSVLYQLGVQMPEGVYLTDLRASGPDDEGELHLRGWAANHLLVSQFLDELENISILSNNQCNFSSVSNTREGKTQFEISASVAASR